MKLSQYAVPILAVVVLLVGLVWSVGGACAPLQGDTSTGPALSGADLLPRKVTVTAVHALDLVELSEGRQLRLSGVGENLRPFRDEAVIEAARKRLAARTIQKEFMLHPDDPRPVDRSELRGELWYAGSDNRRVSINEELLSSGDALLDMTRGPAAGDDRFRAAANAVAIKKSRRLQIPLGFQAGIVLPLYSKEQNFDYGPRLQEIKDHGAAWVSILFVWMVDKIDSHVIRARNNEYYKEDNRSPSDEVLVKTIQQAKALGLRVLLLPVTLPYKPGPDDWRGSLRPKNREGFFENYGQFILRHADMAEALGVDGYSIGSELISLEGEGEFKNADTAGWRRIIRSVRARFGGRITYSANWDHYWTLQILDELDFVGLTAYYSLTKNPNATVDELVEAWKPVYGELERFSKERGLPMVFTEVGYFSLEGTNTDPWNYKMGAKVDLEVQKRCYDAFAKVFGKPSFLAGAYFFDWYDEGGPNDKSYSPRGKPAAESMKKFLETARNLPPPEKDPGR